MRIGRAMTVQKEMRETLGVGCGQTHGRCPRGSSGPVGGLARLRVSRQ